MKQETIVRLHPDGRITRQYLGDEETLINPEEFLARFGANNPQGIQSVGLAPNGKRFHSAACNAINLVCYEIDSLMLNCQWSAQNPTIPVFNAGNGPRVQRLWLPPVDTKLIAVGTDFRDGGFVLQLLVMDGMGQCYRTPVPNIHPSGHVCLGDNYTDESATMIERTHQAIEIYNRAPCNAELNNVTIPVFCSYAPDRSGTVKQTDACRNQPHNKMTVVSTPTTKAIQMLYGFPDVPVVANDQF